MNEPTALRTEKRKKEETIHSIPIGTTYHKRIKIP